METATGGRMRLNCLRAEATSVGRGLLVSIHRVCSNIHRYTPRTYPYSHMHIKYSEAHQNTHGHSRDMEQTYT